MPEVEYFAGDMEDIRAFFEHCRAEGKDTFYIDDITWNDLDMDDVFKRINQGVSTAGEQYLYHMLRRPMNRAQYHKQKALIDLMAAEPDVRKRLTKILRKSGRQRSVTVTALLHTQASSGGWLSLYVLLALLLPVSIVLAVTLGMPGVWMMLGCLIVNGALHEYRRHRCDREIRLVNHCVGLAFALRRMRRLRNAGLDAHLQTAYEHLGRLRFVERIGSVSSAVSDDIIGMLMTVLLLDLILFEVLKRLLRKQEEALLAIHEAVGQVDAAMAIVAWREGTLRWTEPEIDFAARKAFFHADGVVHPLVEDAVPNEVRLDRPLLITGANASGKSTYIKAAILCALLAQTICTAPAASCRLSACRIYSSMAVRDQLQSGESYYIAEIKALKRILDAPRGLSVLCAVDEVLRGTNTIERIAASAEILKELCRRGFLCLVATHDAELCTLVGDTYNLAHFQETMTTQDILFDFRLRPGPATSRNAIDLLKLMGFDEKLVAAAHERANGYVESGKWTGTPSVSFADSSLKEGASAHDPRRGATVLAP